jgi:hypothetical protein
MKCQWSYEGLCEPNWNISAFFEFLLAFSISNSNEFFFINLLNFKSSLVIIEFNNWIEFWIQIGWIWFEIQSKPNSIQFGEN